MLFVALSLMFVDPILAMLLVAGGDNLACGFRKLKFHERNLLESSTYIVFIESDPMLLNQDPSSMLGTKLS